MADTTPPQDPQDNNPHAQTESTPPPADPAGAPQDINDGQADAMLTGDAKTFVLLSHVLGIFFPILAPLLIWLLKKEELPAIEPQCKETLNFQITIFGLAFILGGLLGWIPILGWCITLPLAGLLWLFGVIMLIIATIAASNGKPYKFPWKLDLVK